MGRKSAYFWILCAVFSLFGFAAADDIHGHEDPSLFGNLNQHDLDKCVIACGPAAAVNSFVFLQRYYPFIYKNPLIDPWQSGAPGFYDAEVKLGNLLCKSMGCQAPGGTTFTNFVAAKQGYFTSKNNDVPTHINTYVDPTPEQLAFELNHNEDVEILMNFPDPDFKGHYVTLYDIDWDTLTESGSIHFIDGLDGKQHLATLVGNQVFYTEPDGTEHVGHISRAAAESPVPEPGSLMLFGTVAGLAAARLRLHRRE